MLNHVESCWIMLNHVESCWIACPATRSCVPRAGFRFPWCRWDHERPDQWPERKPWGPCFYRRYRVLHQTGYRWLQYMMLWLACSSCDSQLEAMIWIDMLWYPMMLYASMNLRANGDALDDFGLDSQKLTQEQVTDELPQCHRTSWMCTSSGSIWSIWFLNWIIQTWSDQST